MVFQMPMILIIKSQNRVMVMEIHLILVANQTPMNRIHQGHLLDRGLHQYLSPVHLGLDLVTRVQQMAHAHHHQLICHLYYHTLLTSSAVNIAEVTKMYKVLIKELWKR
jgi:hypothetical protein